MRANETKFQDLVASNYQYVVPLFQRPYSWTKREWSQLWTDIEDLTESNIEHFIGSIVNIPTPSVPAGVSKFLLIDGQQRMTTLFVMMMALRDRARSEGADATADEISDMIVNRHKKGDDHYKLMPTQADRAVYKALVSGQIAAPSPDDTALQNCYRYFKAQVATCDIRAIFEVISSRLSIVSIVLDKDDNPHVVFESLNAKGRSLSQADLIRNYFFMRIHVDRHEIVNATFWQPMQDALGENMTEFIRHYLMREGSNVRQPDVYQVLRKRIEDERVEVLTYLERLAQFSNYYCRILFPAKYESDEDLRWRMERLNTLQVTVAYPFLLNVYSDVENGRLLKEQQYAILETLENYIFRRAICGVPTYELNKIFPALYGWIRAHSDLDFVTAVCTELQKRRYPRDDEFKESLIADPLYGAGDRITRTHFLLATLELAYGHKEVVDLSKCSIEHIMPQTLNLWWQQHLGDSFADTHEIWVNTLGNLTLTAYNSELGNKPLPEKQAFYAASKLTLNMSLSEYSSWNETNIRNRANALAEDALKVWRDFRPTIQPSKSSGNVYGTKPYRLTILEQSIPVTSWTEVLISTVNALLDLSPEKMEELRDEFPYFLSDSPFRRSVILRNGMYLNKNWRADAIYRTCRRMIEFAGLEEQDWEVMWE